VGAGVQVSGLRREAAAGPNYDLASLRYDLRGNRC